ncbi:periplasmic heavy metal sensor [Cribrihabitans neustonicus]|uniref:periplasmic heavy metal sensor n=1 Tax=Cribrihabitans neustonicus TaxID=1429085 RepID=UPI003B5C50CA
MSEEGTTGMKPWQKWLLALSLALNLAVIGLAAGAAIRFAGHERGWHRPPSVGAMIFRELDPGTRAALRREAGGGHGSFPARRRAEAEAVIAALSREPFDAAVLMQLLQEQAAVRHRFHLRMQEAWVSQVSAMTPEARAAFAARMQARLERRGKKAGKAGAGEG